MGAMRENVTSNNPSECVLDVLKPANGDTVRPKNLSPLQCFVILSLCLKFHIDSNVIVTDSQIF